MKLIKPLFFGGSVGIIGTAIIWKIITKAGRTIERKNRLIDKYKLYYCLNNKWISLKESQKRVSKYFVYNQMESIAVYGLGDVGLNFCDEVMKDGIKVKYAFDGNLIRYDSYIPIRKLEDELEEVDAIVVTIPDEFEAIKDMLKEKFTCPIIAIDEIIYSI
ncbi:MAG: hypothetical protein K1W16_04650 [Lachnospiraceae bacterium]